MSTATDAYQSALRNFKTAESSAAEMVKLIRAMAECTRGDMFSSFLGWHCGINQITRGGRYDPKANINMGEWPDFDRLKATFVDWGNALGQLQQAWNGLSPDEKIGFTAPPEKIAVPY